MTTQQVLDTVSFISIITMITEFICLIVLAVKVSKIKTTVCEPFQNKKPDYPDKVIELLQAIVSAEQHNTEEIKKLKGEIELMRNGGVKPGIKTKEQIRHEELMKALEEQNKLLQGILDTTSGEEKKKMLEKWKQASDLIKNI